MNIINILKPEAVRVLHGASSKKRLFQELSLSLHTAYGVKAEEATQSLLDREALGPTGFGRGVALPHARLIGLDEIVGCFIRSEKPVDYDAVDRQPVDLIFALFAPIQNNMEHLRALATASRIFRNNDICSKLRANSDPAILYEILAEGASEQQAA